MTATCDLSAEGQMLGFSSSIIASEEVAKRCLEAAEDETKARIALVASLRKALERHGGKAWGFAESPSDELMAPMTEFVVEVHRYWSKEEKEDKSALICFTVSPNPDNSRNSMGIAEAVLLQADTSGEGEPIRLLLATEDPSYICDRCSAGTMLHDAYAFYSRLRQNMPFIGGMPGVNQEFGTALLCGQCTNTLMTPEMFARPRTTRDEYQFGELSGLGELHQARDESIVQCCKDVG